MQKMTFKHTHTITTPTKFWRITHKTIRESQEKVAQLGQTSKNHSNRKRKRKTMLSKILTRPTQTQLKMN